MEVFSDDVHLRQQISVPFLWEETPGKPKTEYYTKSTSTALTTTVTNSSPPSNNKNVGASVPFGWKKESGKPLVQFTNLPSTDNMAYISDDLEEKEKEKEKEKEMYKSYLETFLFETHHNAKESSSSGSFDTMEEEAWRGNSTSSTVKEDDNTEVSMTNFFFPLDAKDEGFLRKACFIQDEGDETMNNGNESIIGQNSIVRRRSMMLGELILLSRRLSCEKDNIIHERDQQRSLTKDFMKKVSACIF